MGKGFMLRPLIRSEMSISEKVLEELEADAKLRRRFAELLVSDPEVRLAVINAVLAGVATKEDVRELRAGVRAEISQLRAEINQLRREMSQLRAEVRAEISQLRSEVRAEVNQLGGEVGQLRAEVRSNFRWTIGVMLTIWGATVIPILLRLIGAI